MFFVPKLRNGYSRGADYDYSEKRKRENKGYNVPCVFSDELRKRIEFDRETVKTDITYRAFLVICGLLVDTARIPMVQFKRFIALVFSVTVL